MTLRSSTGSLTIYYTKWTFSITSSSSQSKMPSQQDNIVSLVWFYTREITITNQILHISMIVMGSLWQWFIQTIENGSNTGKHKFNTLMLSRQWAKSSGEKRENGLQFCSCIDKFTWEICKFSKIKTKKLRKCNQKKTKGTKWRDDYHTDEKNLLDSNLFLFHTFYILSV